MTIPGLWIKESGTSTTDETTLQDIANKRDCSKVNVDQIQIKLMIRICTKFSGVGKVGK